MRLEPNPTNPCFGCGGANPRGMRLVFELDEENQRVRGHFQIPAEYQGSGGWVHGGIIALVLDEAMGKVNRFRQAHAVTADLQVEYLRPMRVEQDLVVEAFEGKAATSTMNAKSAIPRGKYWRGARDDL
jgi:acyl-coenzyme A thioesterase PaaI-like protein